MTKTVHKMIPKTEMVLELERLRVHLTEKRYTISHMAFLSGWTENYLRILEKKGRIPKALRTEGTIKCRYWTEDSARTILYFRKQQEKKSEIPVSKRGVAR